MGRSTTRKTKGTEEDKPEIKCESCGRWVFLDETQFEDVPSAANGEPFTCTICVRFTALEARLETINVIREDCTMRLNQGATEWRLEVANMTARFDALTAEWKGEREAMERELQTERKMREALQEEVAILRSTIQGWTPPVVRAAEQTKGFLSSTTEPDAVESRYDDDSHSGDQRSVSDTGTLLSEGLSADGSQNGEAADKSATQTVVLPGGTTEVSEWHQQNGRRKRSTTKSQKRADTPAEQISMAWDRGSAPATSAKNEGGTQRMLECANPVSTKVSAAIPESSNSAQHPQKNPVRQGGQENCEGRAGHSHTVIVAGDVNAFRLKPTVRKITEHDGRVGFYTTRRATFGEAAKALQQEMHVQQNQQSLVVLHAGLVELQDGADPEEEVRDIRTQLQCWLKDYPGHYYLVYGLPEASQSDRMIREKCQRWNDLMHGVCQALGPRVEFVPVTGFLARHGQVGGTYSAAVARVIGAHLGGRARAFLGMSPRSSYYGSQQVTERAEAGTVVTQHHTTKQKGKRGRHTKMGNTSTDLRMFHALGQILVQLGQRH